MGPQNDPIFTICDDIGKLLFVTSLKHIVLHCSQYFELLQWRIRKVICFPPIDVRILAEFLATVAEKLTRPRSVLNTTTAAPGHMYRALELPNVIEGYEIRMFITALVKSGTSVPMLRSKAMPVGHFHDLLMNWADNDALDLKSLRLKAITLLPALLALTAMLWPSDIALNARQLNSNGK